MKNSDQTLVSIIIVILLIGIAQLTTAQSLIEGEVIDQNGSPMPYANVLVLNPGDSSLVKGTVTNGQGYYTIPQISNGNYLVMVSSVGYQATYSREHVILKNQVVQLPQFILSEDTRQLEVVVVTATKPLYERQMDRMVVNVQSSVTSAGNTVLEIIDRSPGVSVNRGNNSLTMNGKSGVQVMINGKMTRLPIDAVVQMLDGMSSANVEKIELITNPPAQYDAEGDAGIINIVLVENTEQGTNGNLGLTGGYGNGAKWGTNFNLHHRKGKTNFFADYSILSDRSRPTWINERSLGGEEFDKTFYSTSDRNALNTVQNLRLGMAYQISPKTTVELLMTGYRRNWDMDAITENTTINHPDSVMETTIQLHEQNVWQSATGSLGIRHQLTPQQDINFSFDYLYYVNDNPSSYKINEGEGDPGESELVNVSKDTPIQIKVAQLDHAYQINEKLSLTTGLKASISKFRNDVSVALLEQKQWREDHDLSNQSMLDENIWAGYISWKWQAGPALKIDGGIRYEHTDTYLSTAEEEGLVDRNFGNFFPSLTIARQLGELQSLQLAYSRRINRPTFNDMAPFVFFIGSNTFVSGNPALKPALSNALDLTYQHQEWWISVRYNNTNNQIGWLQPEIDAETNQQIFRSQNLNYLNTWSLATGLPGTITEWWELQGDLNLNYQLYQSAHLAQNPKGKAFGVNLNLTSTFNLPHQYTLEINGNFQSKSLLGIWEYEPMGQLNVGVSKKLNNNWGVITLNANDILHTNIWRLNAVIPEANAITRTEYDFNTRSVKLTYTRSFGNKRMKAVNINGGGQEERGRVN